MNSLCGFASDENQTGMEVLGTNFTLGEWTGLNRTNRSDLLASSNSSIIPEIILIVYYIIGAVGVLNNDLVIVIILRSRQLRQYSTNIVIVNQSVIDGLASLFLIVFSVPYTYSGVPSLMLCKFWLNRMPMWCLLITSTFNILCLTLDRYLAILHPIWYKSSYSRKKLMLLLLFPWLFGFGFNSSFAVPTSIVVGKKCLIYEKWPSESTRRAFGLLLVNVEYIIPIILQIYMYGRIIFFVRNRVLKGSRATLPVITNDHDTRFQHHAKQTNSFWSRAQRNSLKTAAIVSTCFLLCWTCDQIYFLVYLLQKSDHYDTELFSYTLIFVVINSCVNPIIYALKYESFQCAVRELFCQCVRPEQTRNAATQSTALSLSDLTIDSTHNPVVPLSVVSTVSNQNPSVSLSDSIITCRQNLATSLNDVTLVEQSTDDWWYFQGTFTSIVS